MTLEKLFGTKERICGFDFGIGCGGGGVRCGGGDGELIVFLHAVEQRTGVHLIFNLMTRLD